MALPSTKPQSITKLIADGKKIKGKDVYVEVDIKGCGVPPLFIQAKITGMEKKGTGCGCIKLVCHLTDHEGNTVTGTFDFDMVFVSLKEVAHILDVRKRLEGYNKLNPRRYGRSAADAKRDLTKAIAAYPQHQAVWEQHLAEQEMTSYSKAPTSVLEEAIKRIATAEFFPEATEDEDPSDMEWED